MLSQVIRYPLLFKNYTEAGVLKKFTLQFISKTTAKRIVNQFIDGGSLKREVLRKTWRIPCNLNHLYYRKGGDNEKSVIDMAIGY